MINFPNGPQSINYITKFHKNQENESNPYYLLICISQTHGTIQEDAGTGIRTRVKGLGSPCDNHYTIPA